MQDSGQAVGDTQRRALRSIPGMPAYLAGNTLDRLADAMLYVALAWAAAHSSATAAVAVLAAGSVARLVVLLLGGAIGDRFGLARVASLTLVVRGVLLGVFAWALTRPHPSSLVLVVVAAAFGLVDGAHVPAMTGISALLARGRELASAQGLVGAATEAMEVLAPPVTGYLLAWPASVAGVGVVLVAVSLLCIVAIRRAASAAGLGDDLLDEESEARPGGLRGLLGDVREGLRAGWHTPGMRLALLVMLVANLAATGPVLAGLPLKAVAEGWPASTYGWASAGLAAGGVVGLLALNRWGGRVTVPLSWAASLLAGGSLGIMALTLTRSPAGAVAGATVTGLCFGPGGRLVISWIQSVSSPQMVGRTMALIQFAIYAGIPLGYLLYGALLGISLSIAGAVMSGALLLMALLMLGWSGTHRSEGTLDTVTD